MGCGGSKEHTDNVNSDLTTVPGECDYFFKLLIIGDSNVGKSSLLLRFTENNFTESIKNTVGVDFKIRTVSIQGRIIKLQIWDTAGQEKFRTITANYYRGSHGVIIVFDLSNIESFEHVQHWLSEIDSQSSSGIKKLLVGNKSDLSRAVPESAVKQLISKENLAYIETSAKEDKNVEAAFLQLVTDCIPNK
eukprot:TRINITY_DN603_c0_g1_i1.p1 TRINITY_DN603_c0_g1~~TRINITY_DN603_c0_g1_i1.p1  ORF type:complete len:191 (-),score=19.59 TRINITY_DN603_c0_g1_i1:19-591(-)